MKFSEVVAQTLSWLQREGRVSYRALKREFDLDDEFLEDVKAEIIEVKRLAVDDNGKVLVWTGGTTVASYQLSVPSSSRPPAPQTRDFGLRTPDSKPKTLDRRQDAGERRQLTVMFCDLVGSTALSEYLDPEELREVVRAYQQTSAAVIERYAGHIAQYLGDGLLVYFGYPVAHEDDAQRAVRAGLEIIADLQLAPPQSTLGVTVWSPLRVRIGIHTGHVVVGEMGGGKRREQLALGDTPNIAARLQGLAAPDSVVISAATQRLVAGLFEYQDLGPQLLKGISAPLSVYRVVGESAAQSRFEVAIGIGLTPLVGREEELGLLRRCWTQAKEGTGQVVLLSGEAGIGKSRLVQGLKEQVQAEGATRIEFRCSPYHQNSAFYPIIEHLHRLLQFTPHDTLQVKIEKLTQQLASYRFPQADTLALLAALLSLPHPEGALPLTLSPQKQKQKTQEALAAWLAEEAERQTVCWVWEDLHWVDPSSLEVLTLLLEQVPTTRLLALLTFRPDFIPPWRPHSHITQLTLGRLGRQHVEAMVEQVTGGTTLAAEVVQQIVSKTDGVPLFVEELTKMVIESIGSVGSGGAPGYAPRLLGIPDTLQDALMARLDRLASVREIAQLGATLGREFSYHLLHAVSPLDEEVLQQGLRQLVEAELLYQRGLLPQATYLFKHALVQDTAYQSLLKSTRQQYHQQIAQRLEEQFPDTTETQPELVAHHYTEAGLAEQAIPYWQHAAQRAVQRSANEEAISHLTKGLELLKTLPDTAERTQQELTLQLALGAALRAGKGYSVPDVEKAYTRARVLCQQLGETPQLVPVLYSLVVFYFNQGELQTAFALAQQALHLAQSVQDPYLLSLAHNALGWTLYLRGEWTSARAHSEQMITLYDPQQHSRPTVFMQDPRMECLSLASNTLWFLGYPEQALKRSQEGMALAAGLSHPLHLAYALRFAALFHLHRREEQVAREQAEMVITLSTEQGFPYFLVWGMVERGWALAEQGQQEEGIAQMQQSLTAFQAMGTKVLRPNWLAQLAKAYGKVGKTEEGLTVLAEALAVVDKSGERFYEAELYRLKGTLILRAESQSPESPPLEAEACFQKAIEVARSQSAKSLELRAVMSLSRLWQQQGKKKEARQMLAEIYNWFTEGFDTKDLQEAKALLEELT